MVMKCTGKCMRRTSNGNSFCSNNNNQKANKGVFQFGTAEVKNLFHILTLLSRSNLDNRIINI